jgi:hypothetical protein
MSAKTVPFVGMSYAEFSKVKGGKRLRHVSGKHYLVLRNESRHIWVAALGSADVRGVPVGYGSHGDFKAEALS